MLPPATPAVCLLFLSLNNFLAVLLKVVVGYVDFQHQVFLGLRISRLFFWQYQACVEATMMLTGPAWINQHVSHGGLKGVISRAVLGNSSILLVFN